MAEIVVEKATLKSGIFSFKTKSGQAAFYVERQQNGTPRWVWGMR